MRIWRSKEIVKSERYVKNNRMRKGNMRRRKEKTGRVFKTRIDEKTNRMSFSGIENKEDIWCKLGWGGTEEGDR